MIDVTTKLYSIQTAVEEQNLLLEQLLKAIRTQTKAIKTQTNILKLMRKQK